MTTDEIRDAVQEMSIEPTSANIDRLGQYIYALCKLIDKQERSIRDAYDRITDLDRRVH